MMQRIIDVDAHFEPGDTWLADYPKLAARLPAFNVGHNAARSLLGEMLREVPEDRRPSWDDLVPPGVKTMFGREKADEEKRRREFTGYEQMPVGNAKARLKWMDGQGIH